MIRILCSLIFLFCANNAFGFHADSENHFEKLEDISSLSEPGEYKAVISETRLPGACKKSLPKIKISIGIRANFKSWESWPAVNHLDESQNFLPAYSISRIIYPFHSFF